jgi:predicted naringenin-chalcone synthase
MAWSIGDRGFEMRLTALVPRLLGTHIGKVLEATLGLAPAALSDLRFWAVHPGGPAILDEIERSLALDSDHLRSSRGVLREFGNMSSPTVLFVLERIWSELASGGTSPSSEQGVALAFGPGLTFEAVLFETRE